MGTNNLLCQLRNKKLQRLITMSTNRASPTKPANVEKHVLETVSIAHQFSNNGEKKKVLKVSIAFNLAAHLTQMLPELK